jgi:hypothetical protein
VPIALARPRSDVFAVVPYDTFETGIESSSSLETIRRSSAHHATDHTHSCRHAAARSRPRRLLCQIRALPSKIPDPVCDLCAGYRQIHAFLMASQRLAIGFAACGVSYPRHAVPTARHIARQVRSYHRLHLAIATSQLFSHRGATCCVLDPYRIDLAV